MVSEVIVLYVLLFVVIVLLSIVLIVIFFVVLCSNTVVQTKKVPITFHFAEYNLYIQLNVNTTLMFIILFNLTVIAETIITTSTSLVWEKYSSKT